MRYCSLAVLLCLSFGGSVAAQTKSECGDSSIHYDSGDNQTREETLRAMDRALFDALNRYDDCMTENSRSGGGQSASSGGDGSGASGGGGASSTAASDVEGTEKPKVAVAPLEETEEDGEVSQEVPRAIPNGKIPDDIPAANNDDILQKKVREAAMNEPDPEKRERLWEEYRKLKGIPSS